MFTIDLGMCHSCRFLSILLYNLGVRVVIQGSQILGNLVFFCTGDIIPDCFLLLTNYFLVNCFGQF